MTQPELESSGTSTPTRLADDESVQESPNGIYTLPSRLQRVQSNAGQDLEKRDEKNAIPVKAETHNVRTITGFKWVLILAALYSSALLYGLDTTIAADTQGPVTETFGEVDKLAWLGSGFPLGSVAVILMVGSLYSSFNMKWIFITAVLLFEVGSAICGAAPNMNALIIGRVLAGSGGAGIYLGCLNYISSLTGEEERGRYITGIGFFWGLGAVLGPVVGGSLAESSATWRWAFYINLPAGALALPIMLFFLPSLHPTRGVPIMSRVKNLDFLGFTFNAGIWVLFALAFTMAGSGWSWNDGRTITTLVVFGVLVMAYALQQHFTILTTTSTRSFPTQLLKSRTAVLLYIATSANITSLFVVIYFIPIYFQFVHNDSAIMAAVRLLPFVIICVSVNLASGWLLSKAKFYMPFFLASGIIIVSGGASLFAFLDKDTSKSYIYGFTVLLAFGTGLTVQLPYAVGTLTSPEEDMGDIISFLNVAQIGGSVIALVIAGQIFQSYAVQNLRLALTGHPFTDSEIRSGISGARSALFSSLQGGLREAAIDAITGAMQKAFILPIVAGAVLVVVSVFMKRERLFGQVSVM